MNIEDKLVRVEWVDSSTSSPWVLLEDFKDEQCDPIKIVSYGIIVKETDDYLVIAQNYGSNPPQISNTTAIPKGCIIQQNIIKEESKMEEKKTLEELAQPLKNWLVEHNDEVPSSKIVIDKYSVVVIQEIMGGSLNKTIEEPKQEENDQKCEPFRIKKGEWYVCIHDFCNKTIRIGEIIQAEHDDTIRGIGFLYMENKYFRPAFENEIPQKPKWTEEDDTIRCEIIRRMEALDHYWNRPYDQKLIDWLKSLKQRMEEQQ